MYHRPAHIEKYAQDPEMTRPLILCEYAHAMGNSLGTGRITGTSSRSIPSCKAVASGLVDQGLAATRPLAAANTGRMQGDYGEYGTPSDGNFCINIVVYPDRSVKPQTEEMRKVYQTSSSSTSTV